MQTVPTLGFGAISDLLASQQMDCKCPNTGVCDGVVFAEDLYDLTTYFKSLDYSEYLIQCKGYIEVAILYCLGTNDKKSLHFQYR